MECKECKDKVASTITISTSAYELERAKDERVVKRLITTLITIILLWFATIGAFIWYLNQYDYSSESIEYSQDGEGVNIIGDKNGVTYNGSEISD